MINDIFKVIENLIKLLWIREARQKEHFEKIVEPLFQDLNKIHENYNRILSNVILRLSNNPKSIVEIADTLRGKRTELEHLRGTTDIISREYKKRFKDGVLKDFVTAVSFYFPDGDLNTDPSGCSYILDLLENWDGSKPLVDPYGTLYKKPAERLILEVKNKLNQLNSSWEEVCRRYAQLKSKYLKAE